MGEVAEVKGVGLGSNGVPGVSRREVMVITTMMIWVNELQYLSAMNPAVAAAGHRQQ